MASAVFKLIFLELNEWYMICFLDLELCLNFAILIYFDARMNVNVARITNLNGSMSYPPGHGNGHSVLP